jgi:hypothetical protein
MKKKGFPRAKKIKRGVPPSLKRGVPPSLKRGVPPSLKRSVRGSFLNHKKFKRGVPPSLKRSMKKKYKEKTEYHHAMLGLVVVIIFLFAGIAMQYNVRTTGYAVAPAKATNYDVVKSYTMSVYNCKYMQDNFDPFAPGYVVHSGDVVSRDSCIDQASLLEYSCDAVGRFKADIINCRFGCVKNGADGYCR